MKKNKQQEIKENSNLDETLNLDKKEETTKKKEKEPMVEGIFRNWEISGSPLTFSFAEGKESPKRYTFEDGKTYVIPVRVARHINRCTYPVNEAETDSQGHYLGKREGIVRRFSFRRIDDLIDDVG